MDKPLNALDITGCLIFYSAKALPTNGCDWTQTWRVLVSQWFWHYFLLWIWWSSTSCSSANCSVVLGISLLVSLMIDQVENLRKRCVN